MSVYDLIPARTALINVDMQTAFVEGTLLSAPDGPRLIEPINKLAAACRAAGMMVVHTLHVVRDDGSNLGSMGKLIGAERTDLIKESTETAKLHPGIEVGANDILLYKPRYGAFTGTDLDLILRSNGIDSIIVTGICTNVCCETTAREAGMRDYQVFFTSDGTETFPIGDFTVPQIKQATLTTLGLLFAQIVTVEETIAMIQEQAGAVSVAAE